LQKKEREFGVLASRFDEFGLCGFIKVPVRTCFSIIFLVAAPKPVFTASKKLRTSSPELKHLPFFMHGRLSELAF